MKAANLERDRARLSRVLTPTGLRMPQWVSGLALLTAVIVAAPETVSLVAASAQEMPKVSVRTVRGPGAQKPAATPPKPVRKVASRPVRRSRHRSVGPEVTAAASRRKPPPEAAKPEQLAKVASDPGRTRRSRLHKTSESPDQVAAVAAEKPAEKRHYRRRARLASPDAPPAKRTGYAEGEYTLVRQGTDEAPVLILKRSPAHGKELKESRQPRRKERSDQGAALPATPVRSAVAPAAWQQSTDRREDAWFQEKRDAPATPVAVARD